MAELTAAGVQVFALSYDEPDALRDFRDAYGITFTLLSDPDSKIIRQYGILNTLIAEDDHPWFGIPYPGTYITDTDGIITHKFFENNLALRASPEQMLRAAQGEKVDIQPATQTNTDTIAPQIFVEGDRLAAGVLRDLVVRFNLPPGRHLYAPPAPNGMLAADITLDEHRKVVARPLQRPASETHKLAGTDETFEVYNGTVELRLPLTVNGTLTGDNQLPEITLSGTVCWQACDDEVCDVPQRQQFEITVPVTGAVISELGGPHDNPLVKPMNGVAHFEKMRKRRE